MEVHQDPWWIRKYESYGFRYSPELSEEIRTLARREDGIGPDGKRFRAQHLFMSTKVFINPAVASLPRIVTLHDFSIEKASDGQLKMSIQAKTYHYSGDGEGN